VKRARGTLFAAVIAACFFATGASAQTSVPQVTHLSLDGVVDPFSASYVKDGIRQANDSGAAAILITIDTPGGLDSSMREITQAILNSDVAVVCYVHPSGARAASAGTFILLSGSIAAMTPGTNVGAAHPVGVSGVVEEEKATNDAAAYIVSIAEQRGRNADWAEQAVRDSVSISAEQAVEQDVVDLLAPDIPALLAGIDGMTVTTAEDQSVTLDTAGASVTDVNMNPFVAFLHALLDPNIAFVFFWLGFAFIVLEIFAPGGVVGTIGAIMLVFSIAAFGMLPVQLVGLALLIASGVFFILELKHPGIGVPAVGGAVCLVAGGLLLFDSAVPNSRVSLWVILPMAAVVSVFFGIVIGAAMRMRRAPLVSGVGQLVGLEGTVRKPLRPDGIVQVASETWTAISDTGNIPKGARVRVTRVDGLNLHVETVDSDTPHDDQGRSGE
jgi:membrane-bound serine protease (ClpP class)